MKTNKNKAGVGENHMCWPWVGGPANTILNNKRRHFFRKEKCKQNPYLMQQDCCWCSYCLFENVPESILSIFFVPEFQHIWKILWYFLRFFKILSQNTSIFWGKHFWSNVWCVAFLDRMDSGTFSNRQYEHQQQPCCIKSGFCLHFSLRKKCLPPFVV